MKKTLDIKKLILLNMPYILLGLFATNFGEAWRMAQGRMLQKSFFRWLRFCLGRCKVSGQACIHWTCW